MTANEKANKEAGEKAVEGVCALINDSICDFQGKILRLSTNQDALNLANKTMSEKLDQMSEKADETKTLLSSLHNQLQQQKKATDKSFRSLQEVYDELAISKSQSLNQESTITDMKSQIQTLQKNLENSRLDSARKEDLLKELRLQHNSPTTSPANESNDSSNTDNTNESPTSPPQDASTDTPNVTNTVPTNTINGSNDAVPTDAQNTNKIPAYSPQDTSTDAPKVTITVPTNTINGPNGISNSNNTNETPVPSPLDAASADAQDTINTVSIALEVTENGPTTRPSTIQNETFLLSDLPVTLDDLNADSIKAILTSKNLSQTGRKHELVERLRGHLTQQPNPPTPTV